MLLSLLKRFWPYIVIAIMSYSLGAFLHQKTKIKTVTKTEIRENVRTRILERPDGSKETVIVETRTKDETQRQDKTIVARDKKWLVGLGSTVGRVDQIYNVRVERKVFLDLYVGGYYSTRGDAGVSLTYTF